MFQPTKPSIATPKLETIYITVVPQSITIISAATAEHAFRQLGVVSGAPASNKGKSSKRDGVACKSPPRYSIMHTTITIAPNKQRIRFVPRNRSVSGFSAHIIAIITMMRHSPTTHSFLDVYRRNPSVKPIVPSQFVNVSRGTLKAMPYTILYMMLTPLRKSLCERVVDWISAWSLWMGGLSGGDGRVGRRRRLETCRWRWALWTGGRGFWMGTMSLFSVDGIRKDEGEIWGLFRG
jgi:hypothetical protein